MFCSFTTSQIEYLKEALDTPKIPIKKARLTWEGSASEINSKKLADYGFVVWKAPNTVLLKEGDISKEMYFVLEGTVKVTVGGTEVAQIESGQFFGEMSMVDGLPRTATITTVTDCKLLEIDNKNFYTVIQTEPSIAIKMLETVIKRFRAQNEILSKSIWQNN